MKSMSKVSTRKTKMKATRPTSSRRPARTFDGSSGQPLGSTSTDYVDFGLDSQDPTWSDSSPQGNASASTSPATLPTVAVSATPLSSDLSTTLARVPWWVWALLGLGAGYFIARQYGHKIGRALAPAG